MAREVAGGVSRSTPPAITNAGTVMLASASVRSRVTRLAIRSVHTSTGARAATETTWSTRVGDAFGLKFMARATRTGRLAPPPNARARRRYTSRGFLATRWGSLNDDDVARMPS